LSHFREFTAAVGVYVAAIEGPVTFGCSPSLSFLKDGHDANRSHRASHLRSSADRAKIDGERLHRGVGGQQESHMKTLILVLAGALIGIAVASVVVPPALSWYTSPGGLPQGAQIQALVQISEVIRYATSRLIRAQVIGAAIGAGLGLVVGILRDVRSRRRAVA
jgi:hypothetical protein